MTQTVLTHASRDHWVIPFLNAVSKNHYFDPKNIIDYQDYDFKPKGSNPEGIIMAVDALNLDPAEIIFVEDSLINLQVAKDHFPSLNTALKTNNAPSKTEGADMIIHRPLDILKKMEASLFPNISRISQQHLKL